MNATSKALLVSFFALIPAASFSDDRMLMLNFSNSPITHVVDLYENLSGSKVTVEEGFYPIFTLKTETRLTVRDTLILIRDYAESIGIVFTNTIEGIHIYPDDSKMPAGVRQAHYNQNGKPSEPSHNQFRQKRSADLEAAGSRKNLTSEELKREIDKFRKQVIDAGLPPLPSDKNKAIDSNEIRAYE